ncbi:MAG: M20/M25/M40 family metallo-hydrolase, partial [Firmicutes bacterium]|nr:M20/M25/M40 family metallo-hydrolase [Bacillota bacterium]
SQSYNVIASKKPGRGHGTGKVVLVGAHLDSVSVGTGANDNASGVAIVLEAARILSRYDLASEVRFLVFGAEEIGLVGSNYYVNSLSPEELSRIIGMINMDMVGVGDACSSGNVGDVDWLVEFGVATADEMGLEMANATMGTNSDHWPFENAGVPVNFVTWRPDPYYHTSGDTIDKIVISNLDWVGDIVTSNIYDLAKTPLPESMTGLMAKAKKYTSVNLDREIQAK